MTVTSMLWALPSLGALVLGVLVWYYRRKYLTTETALTTEKRDNDNLRVTLTVERKISENRKMRAQKLEAALLARQQEDHDADAKIPATDLAASLRSDGTARNHPK